MNGVHLLLEYLYEFLRGTRLASTNQLELCERPVSSFMEALQAAFDYIELGIAAEDGTLITEGAFRLADVLMWLTPIFVSCHLTQAYVNLTLNDEVSANLQEPYRLLLNVMRN